MYTLYYSPGACSMAVHVLLNELNVPYTLEKSTLENGEKNPEFLKVSPRGAVPAITIDGEPMLEGGAILLYLADKHQSPLMPQEGLERARALQMLMFANATLHPAYARMFGLKKSGLAGEVVDNIMDQTFEQINKLWAEVDAMLAKQPYVCGQECTVADILLTVIGNWALSFASDKIKLGSNTKAMFARVIKRPSYQKALASEHVEYKAAA